MVIELGYADKLVPVVSGQITSLSPAFPASSSPTIRISGTDGMQKLKDSKPRPGQQVYYKNKADWEIAEQVAQRAPNKMQVDIPDKTGPQHPLVVQKNQDDASFLMERAKRIDYDCYVTSDVATRAPRRCTSSRRPTAATGRRSARSGWPTGPGWPPSSSAPRPAPGTARPQRARCCRT